MEKVMVKGSWLNACGYGDQDTEFNVIRTQQTSAVIGSGFDRMYIIDTPWGEWTVAMCRLVPIKVYRKYDGYTYEGVIVHRTKNTIDIQIPGHRIPTRFHRQRVNTVPGRHENKVQAMYCYPV